MGESLNTIIQKKKIVVLGATGSIGSQCLEIVETYPERFEVVGLAAKSGGPAFEQIVERFRPTRVALYDESAANALSKKFSSLTVEAGAAGLKAVAGIEADVVVVGIMGFAALAPTLEAVRQGKTVALANKESIITAGGLLKKAIADSGCVCIPVDSEHNALYQLLLGQDREAVGSLVITASGGPFFAQKDRDLHTVTPEEAIRHPNWSMGPKISVDSATLMNKGLEFIEAHILFDFPADKIEIWIHPQSIVHGALWFKDNSCIAQLNRPNMKCSIGYAMSYPERLDNVIPKLSFKEMSRLEFFEPDEARFPALRLAKEALRAGPSHLVALNALNEIAVEAFLDKRIPFTAIPQLVEAGLARHSSSVIENIEQVFALDEEARCVGREVSSRFSL